MREFLNHTKGMARVGILRSANEELKTLRAFCELPKREQSKLPNQAALSDYEMQLGYLERFLEDGSWLSDRIHYAPKLLDLKQILVGMRKGMESNGDWPKPSDS
jgi:hypothetical protein